MSTVAPISSSARPTRVRFRVLGLRLGLAAVTYLDRACIGTLAGDIMRDLDLTKEQMSWVFSAFGLAYALFEIPTAWWADRQGTRTRPHPHRPVVVSLHPRDRHRLEFWFDAGDTLPVRGR
jgi:MFS family permease